MYHYTYDLATMIDSQPISLLLITDSIEQVTFDITHTVDISADDLRFICSIA